MRDNREDTRYGDFSRNYRQEGYGNHRHWRYHGREHAHLGDAQNEPGEYYRLQQSERYGWEGGPAGTREDYYKEMYDTSNYSDQPRFSDYGLPRGAESDLDSVGRFPYAEGPYERQPRNYSYRHGYNPNYDNPEEGDRYRDFESRGNHGYRHDGSYGNEDRFREFGNDHYRHDDDRHTRYSGYNH